MFHVKQVLEWAKAHRLVLEVVGVLLVAAALALGMLAWIDAKQREGDQALAQATQALERERAATRAERARTDSVRQVARARADSLAKLQRRSDSLGTLATGLRLQVRDAHLAFKAAATAADSGIAAIAELGALRPLAAKLIRQHRADSARVVILTADRDAWRASAERQDSLARMREMALGGALNAVQRSRCTLINLGPIHALRCPSRTVVAAVALGVGIVAGVAGDELVHRR